MRNAIAMALVTALNLATATDWIGLSAQTPVGPPAQPFLVTQEDIRHMLSINEEDTSMGSTDAGEFIVDVWLDQRMPHPRSADGRAMVHSDLTEIYVVQRGSATWRMGGRMENPQYVAGLPDDVAPGGAQFRPPTYMGKQIGGEEFTVGVGDIVVVPPNTVHQWVEVLEEFDYIILRLDPERYQPPDFRQPLLER